MKCTQQRVSDIILYFDLTCDVMTTNCCRSQYNCNFDLVCIPLCFTTNTRHYSDLTNNTSASICGAAWLWAAEQNNCYARYGVMVRFMKRSEQRTIILQTVVIKSRCFHHADKTIIKCVHFLWWYFGTMTLNSGSLLFWIVLRK